MLSVPTQALQRSENSNKRARNLWDNGDPKYLAHRQHCGQVFLIMEILFVEKNEFNIDKARKLSASNTFLSSFLSALNDQGQSNFT